MFSKCIFLGWSEIIEVYNQSSILNRGFNHGCFSLHDRYWTLNYCQHLCVCECVCFWWADCLFIWTSLPLVCEWVNVNMQCKALCGSTGWKRAIEAQCINHYKVNRITSAFGTREKFSFRASSQKRPFVSDENRWRWAAGERRGGRRQKQRLCAYHIKLCAFLNEGKGVELHLSRLRHDRNFFCGKSSKYVKHVV